MLNFIKKILPTQLKHAMANSLREILCPPVSVPENTLVFAAGKPGTPNLWWNELEKYANKPIFPPLSVAAKQACQGIRDAYRPVLARYGVNAEDFFWGSIKNEEAEALYQLVLERRPQVVYQIGTFVGYSALVIAHALRANGSGVLIAVDPEIPHRTFINPVNVAREAAQTQGLADYIQFERGWHSTPLGDYLGLGLKRAIPIVGLEVLEKIKSQGIDLAFIDGDHSSACTLTDFLLLKDYLNLNGIAIFHDVLSWPTVAQAIFLIWHDIHYYVRGTAAYFALDVRRGQDGLAALQRIANENFPTLQLKVIDSQETPLSDVTVKIPSLDFIAVTDREGTIYVLTEIASGVEIHLFHSNYLPLNTHLMQGTNGDFISLEVTLVAK